MARNDDELISEMLRSIDRQADELDRQQKQLEKHNRELDRHTQELVKQSRKSDEFHAQHMAKLNQLGQVMRDYHNDQSRQYAEQSENTTRLGIILNRIIRKNNLKL